MLQKINSISLTELLMEFIMIYRFKEGILLFTTITVQIILVIVNLFALIVSGEQQYCRKWDLEKMSKIDKVKMANKYSKKFDLVQNAEFFFFFFCLTNSFFRNSLQFYYCETPL